MLTTARTRLSDGRLAFAKSSRPAFCASISRWRSKMATSLEIRRIFGSGTQWVSDQIIHSALST